MAFGVEIASPEFKQPAAFDPMGFMQKGLNMQATQQQILASQQEVEASKASQANVEAQNPGIVADSAQKELSMKLRNELKNNSDKFMEVDPKNPTGPMIPNYAKVTDFLAKNGGLPEAQAFAVTDLNIQKQRIANAQSVNTKNALLGKAINDGYDHASLIAARLPASLQVGAMTTFRNGVIPMFKDDLANNPGMMDNLWPSEQDGGHTPAMIKARTQGSVAQDVRTGQEISQENTEIAADAQRLNDNLYKGQNGVLPPEIRVGTKLSASNDAGDLTFLNDGRTAAHNMVGQLKTGPGSTLSMYVSKYGTQDPQAQKLANGMEVYNANPLHKDKPLTSAMGIDVISAALTRESGVTSNKMHVKEQITNSGGGVQRPAAAAGTPVQPVRIIRNSDGKMLTMPAADAAARIASGQYKAAH